MSAEFWDVWDETSKIGEALTEEAARAMLKDADNPYLYAENEAGDYIEYHDSSIVRKASE